MRKQEGLAEGTNEEDGCHGLRGRSEVGELVRMRSRWHASAADQAGPMAVKPLRCASHPLGTNRSRRLASSVKF